MLKRRSVRTRVSIAISEPIRQEAPRHPELVGLPRGTSRSRVFERLLELGWDAVLRARREREQLSLYVAYAQDAEQQAVARADDDEIRRSGVV